MAIKEQIEIRSGLLDQMHLVFFSCSTVNFLKNFRNVSLKKIFFNVFIYFSRERVTECEQGKDRERGEDRI